MCSSDLVGAQEGADAVDAHEVRGRDAAQGGAGRRRRRQPRAAPAAQAQRQQQQQEGEEEAAAECQERKCAEKSEGAAPSTAQTSLREIRRAVRTIIDIGGQDSKVICLDGEGNVTNFVMNDKCAAGTGRFLELMARTLELEMDGMAAIGLSWEIGRAHI